MTSIDGSPGSQNRSLFIGVHAGAGHHASRKSHQYKNACETACLQAMKILRNGLALDAVVEAVRILEVYSHFVHSSAEQIHMLSFITCNQDDPCTNAGFGSNLTLDGRVETDAGLMDGDSLVFAAVGAVPDVKNPIVIAYELAKQQMKGRLSFGRIPPCLLVGSGAREWAVKHGIPGCGPTSNVATEDAVKMYKRFKGRVSPKSVTSEERLDTVGAVALDASGSVASAVSSGGLLLKTPGRVGQAAVYGCGCWAENCKLGPPHSTAVSTSGCGEYLIKTTLAKELARQTDAGVITGLHDCFKNNFLDSPFLCEAEDKYAGAIILRYDSQARNASFQWAHTTHSMCVGYLTSHDDKPQTRLSRLSSGQRPGHTIVVEGMDVAF